MLGVNGNNGVFVPRSVQDEQKSSCLCRCVQVVIQAIVDLVNCIFKILFCQSVGMEQIVVFEDPAAIAALNQGQIDEIPVDRVRDIRSSLLIQRLRGVKQIQAIPVDWMNLRMCQNFDQWGYQICAEQVPYLSKEQILEMARRDFIQPEAYNFINELIPEQIAALADIQSDLLIVQLRKPEQIQAIPKCLMFYISWHQVPYLTIEQILRLSRQDLVEVLSQGQVDAIPADRVSDIECSELLERLRRVDQIQKIRINCLSHILEHQALYFTVDQMLDCVSGDYIREFNQERIDAIPADRVCNIRQTALLRRLRKPEQIEAIPLNTALRSIFVDRIDDLSRGEIAVILANMVPELRYERLLQRVWEQVG